LEVDVGYEYCFEIGGFCCPVGVVDVGVLVKRVRGMEREYAKTR